MASWSDDWRNASDRWRGTRHWKARTEHVGVIVTTASEVKAGDLVRVVSDYPLGHPMGQHQAVGDLATLTVIRGRGLNTIEGYCTIHLLRSGVGRYVDKSHVVKVDESEIPDKSKFPPGTWVHLDGVTDNFYYVMPDEVLPKYFVRLQTMHSVADNIHGAKTYVGRLTNANFKVTPADPIALGSEVVISTTKRNAARGRRGTVIAKVPCALGGDLYRVFLPGDGSGYEYLYGSELEIDPKSLEPDEHGHVHKWTVKWDGTYRECLCGVKQWQLACWSRYQWQDKLPVQQKQLHYTLDFDKSSTKRLRDLMEEGTGWTSEPHRTRSYGIIPKGILDTPINIIGCGAIGGFTALGLMKMGFKNFHLWDHDKVAIENVGTQLYGTAQVGLPKVEALTALLMGCGPDRKFLNIVTHPERWQIDKVQGTSETAECANGCDPDDHGEDCEFPELQPAHIRDGGIVIMAVDSMAARRSIWDSIREYCEEDAINDEINIDWVVDGRMGAEHANMYTMDPDDYGDITTYEKTLYSDEEALQEPCTAAGTAYTAFSIAGWICKAVKDVLTDNPKYIRIGMWNIADNQQTIYHKVAAEQVQATLNRQYVYALWHTLAPPRASDMAGAVRREFERQQMLDSGAFRVREYGQWQIAGGPLDID